MSSHIHFQANGPRSYGQPGTGVSLHAHTLHSRESLDFVSQALQRVPVLAGVVRERVSGIDLSRGWWTPPLGPQEIWSTERRQIENLDLKPLVSITDHDNMEAPCVLQLQEDMRDVPLSFEWTVP